MERRGLAAVLPGVLLVTGPLCWVVILMVNAFAHLSDPSLPARAGVATRAALPGLVHTMVLDGARSQGASSPWMQAALTVEPPLEVALEEAGVFEALASRVKAVVGQLATAAREGRGTVTLDLSGLEEPLTAPPLRDFLTNLLAALPECEQEQLEAWRELMLVEDLSGVVPPACRPGSQIPQDRLQWGMTRALEPLGLRRARAVEIKANLPMPLVGLLLFPVLALLVLVVLMARQGGLGRVLGSSLVVGGLLALATALSLQELLRRLLTPGLEQFLEARFGGPGDSFQGLLSSQSLGRSLGDLGGEGLGVLAGTLLWSAVISLLLGVAMLIPGMRRGARGE